MSDDLVKIDLGDTTSDGTQYIKHTAEQLLMAMARRQRDGASMHAIIAEFDLVGDARDRSTLQRALNVGHNMLERAIKAGATPSETILWVSRDDTPIRSNEDEEDEA